ncbi:MAG: holo-ACP synthase [Candidatus Promineifilaceae bacterium]|nr:holo-ACP synthase [Candidatus Promineifilaceae bacterium]
MIAVGVDIIEVARIERSLDKLGQQFLDRIFTHLEQSYCDGRAERLAGRFALKEAVAKALGVGIGDIRWQEIEVLNDERGKPVLTLHGNARQLADELGLHSWSVSMSHSETNAIGMAVALGAMDFT